MNESPTIHDVAFSCDDNGARFLCVTVHSLLAHYHSDVPLRINVFEGFGGHGEESKAKLRAIVDGFNEARGKEAEKAGGRRNEFFSLRYHNIERFVEPHADVIMNREHSRWNVFTWTPIFTPQVLADATGNVAHFDIDMLFNDDVSKILDLDLGDNLIAAVAEYGKGDPVITEAVWGKGILPPEVGRYFNTGTIVFNTAKCREERTWDRIVAWYREHYDIADRIEQDAWNALYHDRTLLLPLRWNFHDRLVKSFVKWNPFAELWQGNPPRESLEAALNPAILHFWGPKKPWRRCHRPYRRLYHEAMRAVGQVPPREGPWSLAHDLKNRRDLEFIRVRNGLLAGWGYPTGDSVRLLANLERWERRFRGKRRKHRLLAPFEWLGIGAGWLVLPSLPHSLLFRVCDLVASVMYAFDAGGRRQALQNLRLVERSGGVPVAEGERPTPREEKLLRGSYRNMARTVGHAFWTCRGARAKVARVGEMERSCREFLSANKPAVTVSAHLGCWEILSQLALLEGHAMMSVAKRIGTDSMTRLLMRARRSIGQEIVPADGAFRPLMAGIRAGKSLGLLVDQKVDPDDGGMWVRFFGRPIPVSAAPAFFAAKAKAPIIVAWSRPLSGGRYRCEMLDTISAAEARDLWRTTQRCAADLERIIRRHPSRWVMNYDFFSNRPSDRDLRTLAEREKGKAGR